MRPHYPMIPVLNIVGRAFARLGEWCEEQARQLKHCPDCGENLWYGRTCEEKLGLNRK